jgi:hypothetical protein
MPWSDNDLTAIAGGPQATSPFGYTTSIDGQGPCARVIYVSDTGIHELSLVNSRRWTDNDLTAITGGFPDGFASGYTTSLGGEGPCARVVYAHPAGEVHEFRLVGGQNWEDIPLSLIAGEPSAPASSPVGYTTSLGGEGPCARVVYAGFDGDVHELRSTGGQSWAHNDLTAIAGGPQGRSAPFGYTTSIGREGPCARVIYLTNDGHVHELSLVSGRRWADNDLTAIAGGPPARSAPFGYAATGYTTSLDGQGPCARVIYVSNDGHVHELSLVA